jgi:hypothetical protein
MTNKKIFLAVSLVVLSSVTLYGQKKKVGKTENVDKSINWEEFHNSSDVPKDSIDYNDLQGLWNAYKGAYRFGDVVNGMSLTAPMIVEVKGETYRRNNKSEFEKFILDRNLIIKQSEVKSDTGLINKITSKELTISWKAGKNYTRYYYKK